MKELEPDGTIPLDSQREDATAYLEAARPGSSNPARMPKFIGDYRILRILGVGGMGVVYEAEQLSPHRHVALKVMRHAQLVSEAQAHQFRREVETLGRLKHPNVATIFESGQTEDGLDFYAMEMVQGVSLDVWLAQRPTLMTPKEQKLRLRMFRVICEAVHYAHLRGVIHRDLKPANIMVMEDQAHSGAGSHSDGPTLKVLDFGLARLVDPEGQAVSLRTEVGVIMGTLQYMSPEQARGDTLAIDLRTDIYALGVILFEMMAGQRPYELGKAALSEAVRVICEEPPIKLHVSMSGSRGANADLITIVGKSLEKEPDRRYPSAGALSEDVERYLSSQPIVARPQSGLYRTQMFVRRHRFGVSMAVSAGLMLAVFAVAMAIQSRRIAHEAEVSRRVSAFMTRMFTVSDPSEARGNSITAREILDKASKEIATGLNQDPEIQGRLMHSMGVVYHSLGLYSKAEGLLDQSIQVLRRQVGLQHPETLAAMADLATVYGYQGRLKESERLLLEAIPLMRRLKGAEHPDTLRLMKNLCAQYVDQSRYAEAEKLGLEVRRSMQHVLGAEHLDTLKATLVLGNVYHFQERYEEARLLVDGVLGVQRRTLGDEHPATLDSMHNLALIYVDLKRYPEAERLDTEVITIKRRILGPEHPETLGSLNNLGIIYYLEGRYADAEALNRELLGLERKVLGAVHPDVGNTLYCLACLRSRAGDREQAIRFLQEAVKATLPVPGARGMAEDTDLAPLRGDPRFQALIAEIAQTYGRAEQP